MKVSIEFDENQCRMNTSEELDELETAIERFFVEAIQEHDVQSPLGSALRTIEGITFTRLIIEEDEDE